jgi:hypothetical protein
MREAVQIFLPWLSGVPQWLALSLLVAVTAAGWSAVFLTARKAELSRLSAGVVASLSVAIGIGVLAVGRLAEIHLAPMFDGTPQDASNAGYGSFFVLAAEALVGALLFMGYALEIPLGALKSETKTAFRVVVGAGLGLWLAHELITIIYLAHHR